MPAILLPYSSTSTVRFVLIGSGTANFSTAASGSLTGTNVLVSKDGGAFADCTNSATSIGSGLYQIVITNTELGAKQVVVMIAKGSATNVVEPQALYIMTYGSSDAQYGFNFGSALSGQTVGTVTTALGTISANVVAQSGTAVVGTVGRLEVNLSHWLGTAAAGTQGTPNVGTVTFLTSGTVTTVLNGVSATNVTSANVVQILGTAVVGTQGTLTNIGTVGTALGTIDANVVLWKGTGVAGTAGTPNVGTVAFVATGTITTVTNVVSANIVQILGTAALGTAGTLLNIGSVRRVLDVSFFEGTASLDVGGLSSGTIDATGGNISTRDGHFNGNMMVFLEGSLQGVARRINSYTGTLRRFVLENAFATAPGVGDQFIIHAIETPAAAGSGVADWTSTERQQIRYRLGVDGGSAAPATATSNLSGNITVSTGTVTTVTNVVSANVVQILGTAVVATAGTFTNVGTVGSVASANLTQILATAVVATAGTLTNIGTVGSVASANLTQILGTAVVGTSGTLTNVGTVGLLLTGTISTLTGIASANLIQILGTAAVATAGTLTRVGTAVQSNYLGIVAGTVTAGTSPSSGTFDAVSSLPSTINNMYKGNVVLFISGSLQGIGRRIGTYTGASGTQRIIVENVFGTAPATGDQFIVMPVEVQVAAGSGVTDWDATERQQIRYRLGVDGGSSAPATATSNLSGQITITTGTVTTVTNVVSANVVQILGTAAVATAGTFTNVGIVGSVASANLTQILGTAAVGTQGTLTNVGTVGLLLTGTVSTLTGIASANLIQILGTAVAGTSGTLTNIGTAGLVLTGTVTTVTNVVSANIAQILGTVAVGTQGTFTNIGTVGLVLTGTISTLTGIASANLVQILSTAVVATAGTLTNIGTAVRTHYLGFVAGTVSTGTTPSAGTFWAGTSLASTINDIYRGNIVLFVSGSLQGLGHRIGTYVGASGTQAIILENAFGTAPATGDQFIISGVEVQQAAGSGVTDWDATEKQQIRYRLGVDGGSSAPATATSNLAGNITVSTGTVTTVTNVASANVVQILGTAAVATAGTYTNVGTVGSVASANLTQILGTAVVATAGTLTNVGTVGLLLTGTVSTLTGVASANLIQILGTAVVATAGTLTRIGTAVQSNYIGIASGTVTAGTAPSSATFDAVSSLPSTIDNMYRGNIALFISGSLQGVGRRIGTYLGGSGTQRVILENAFATAPATGDQFLIMPVEVQIAAGSGVTDWDATERQQIRYRLGVDGGSAAPATATSNLSGQITISTGTVTTVTNVVSANVAQILGTAAIGTQGTLTNVGTVGLLLTGTISTLTGVASANLIQILSTAVLATAGTLTNVGTVGLLLTGTISTITGVASANIVQILGTTIVATAGTLTNVGTVGLLLTGTVSTLTGIASANLIQILGTAAVGTQGTLTNIGTVGTALGTVNSNVVLWKGTLAAGTQGTPDVGTVAFVTTGTITFCGTASTVLGGTIGTVTGTVNANIALIDGNGTAAGNLRQSALAVTTGSAVSGTLSTTVFTVDLSETMNDHFNDRLLVFISGGLLRQAGTIIDFAGSAVGTLAKITISTLTTAMAAGDKFVIV